jgi:hypothetical protein
LAVASTTVSTYLAAQQAYASQLIPGDPSSPFRAALAMGVAIASGLANVKKILSVQVPGSNGVSSGGGASVAAPVINSTVITRQNNGTKELTDTIVQSNDKKEPIRAYIVAKDLEIQKNDSELAKFKSTY